MRRILVAAVLVLVTPGVGIAQLTPLRIPRSSDAAETPPAKPATPEPIKVPDSLADACGLITQDWPAKARFDPVSKQPLSEGAVAISALDRYLPQVQAAFKTAPSEFAALGKLLNIPDIGMPARTADGGLWLTGICAQIVARRATEIADRDSAAGHRELVEAQLSLSRIQKWQRVLLAGRQVDPVSSRVTSQLEGARVAVNDLMRAHGLLRPVSAAVFAAATTGSNGIPMKLPDVDPATVVAVPETDSIGQVALIRVETTHWGWEGKNLIDLSLRGTFGFRPVDTLAVVSEKVNPPAAGAGSEAPAAKTPTVVLLTRPALFSAFGVRAGAYNERNIEISLVTSATVGRITSDKVLVDPGNPETFVAKLPSGAVRTAWAWELGAEFNLFDNPLRVIHAERGVATPAISFAAGYRWDSRFKPLGELEAYKLENPERRFYFRAMFDALKVFDPRQKDEDARTFDFGFGVEYDRPLWGSTSQVPSVTRWIIRGDINILSATKKDEPKK